MKHEFSKCHLNFCLVLYSVRNSSNSFSSKIKKRPEIPRKRLTYRCLSAISWRGPHFRGGPSITWGHFRGQVGAGGLAAGGTGGPGVPLPELQGLVPAAIKPLSLKSLIVGHSARGLSPGAPLGLQVGGHGGVVVFAHVEVVHVGPVDRPFPVAALLPPHDFSSNTD